MSSSVSFSFSTLNNSLHPIYHWKATKLTIELVTEIKRKAARFNTLASEGDEA